MRPLPIRAVGVPQHAVLGVAVIRGSTVPVVDVAAFFGECSAQPRRFVTVRVADRVVALAVEAFRHPRPRALAALGGGLVLALGLGARSARPFLARPD